MHQELRVSWTISCCCAFTTDKFMVLSRSNAVYSSWPRWFVSIRTSHHLLCRGSEVYFSTAESATCPAWKTGHSTACTTSGWLKSWGELLKKHICVLCSCLWKSGRLLAYSRNQFLSKRLSLLQHFSAVVDLNNILIYGLWIFLCVHACVRVWTYSCVVFDFNPGKEQ